MAISYPLYLAVRMHRYCSLFKINPFALEEAERLENYFSPVEKFMSQNHERAGERNRPSSAHKAKVTCKRNTYYIRKLNIRMNLKKFDINDPLGQTFQ